jgi:predicted alpha/beta-hydrolase family hydrolase
MTPPEELRFRASESSGDVSALLLRPGDARWLLVVAHGAGAGMRHPFMQGVAERLAERRIATFRYQFPYIEAGKRRPDVPRILMATVRSAVAAAAETTGDFSLLAGGKSLGGRMTASAAAEAALPGVRGLVFFGFPLHAPGKRGSERGAHLADVSMPMLFLQGTRDSLADLELLRPLVADVGERATLHVVADADHGFHVPKRSGCDDADVLDELADATAEWAEGIQ